MVRIKICGITRPEDAQAAARAGADAIGLIFVPGSPRCLDVLRARQVLAALPPLVTPVGVFMDAAITDVQATSSALGLRTVQLHGSEPVEWVAALWPLTVIKALAVRDDSIYADIRRWSAAGVSGILLDRPRTAAGSDPAPMPWHLLTPEAVHKQCGATVPLILAGGLGPENVQEAVRTVRPYGVDVSSGVEVGAGIKDHNLIQRFVLGVRGAIHPGVEP
mgnify:CR=1 FL=1